MTFRIGQGFDVHRFAAGRRCILCGVEVPHETGLLGHSDADAPIHALMDAILPLFELDSYGTDAPMITMEAVPGDALDPDVEASYRAAADRHGYAWAKMARLERFAFYERAKKAFLIVQTGETRKYGNIILRKGVTPSGD